MPYVWQNTNWTEFTWKSDELAQPLGRTRLRQGGLLSKVDALGLKFSSEARAEILIEETVKTAAIEGQTLLNERQRKVINRLLDAGSGGFEGGLTTRKYVSMAKVSRATAFREISDMVEKQVLKQNPGGGRSVSYDLEWPDTE